MIAATWRPAAPTRAERGRAPEPGLCWTRNSPFSR